MDMQVNPLTVMTALLAPKPSDIAYTSEDELIISLILRTDSYKFGHPFAYPRHKIRGMAAYGEARVKNHVEIVQAGLQIFVKKYLSKKITTAHVEAAEQFAIAHFGRALFAKNDWLKVVNEYDGHLPLILRALPEGTVVRGGDPLYSVVCLDPDLFWMASGIETSLLRGEWYPTSIATFDRDIKLEMKRYFEISGADMGLLPFALHDFGGRGVTCAEQAEIGGAAHLFNFMGSDTVEGVLAANFYYKDPMAAFSVAATEHSIECSFGLDLEGEREYLRHVLTNLAVPGGIVSIVIDGKDWLRCAKELCTTFADMIIASGAKVVFRPDSGDMLETIPAILQMQEAAFGSVTNDKGYRKINHVGIIQGDGIDRQGMAIKAVYGKILSMGFRADNVIFGSGGGLLQGVTRDSLKFAQKASAILIENDGGSLEWKGIAKDPVSDPGKKSKEGVLTLARHKATGQTKALRLDLGELTDEYEDMHALLYHTGTLYNETTLAEIRERCAV